MSLEAVIAENTSVMRELIAALAHTQVRPATTQEVGDTTVTSIKATVDAEALEKAKPQAEPDPAPQAKSAPEGPIEQTSEYRALKKKFLAMATKKGNAHAATFMEKLGVDNLKRVAFDKYDEVHRLLDAEMAV